MSSGGFVFASGNLEKLLAIPKYLLSLILSWFVPRDARRWVFGSGIGVGEGALVVARRLQSVDPEAQIVWLVAGEDESELATAEGFTAIQRRGWAGFWATLRAGQIIVTHGLGDANRFGIFGGRVIQLWHGAPLKKLHLDSQVTTAVRGPAPMRAVLRRMYLAGAQEVDLFVAGSPLAAQRLRSAFRVDPGKVRVFGDPRDDVLAVQARDPEAAARARAELVAALEAAIPSEASIILYAPTWRDGYADPAIPSESEVEMLREALEGLGAHLVIRSHPLGSGAYEHLLGGRIHALGSDRVRDITPLLGGVDTVITDYSSVALDFSLLGRPIVWFAPDLEQYSATRGLYEPLAVTSAGHVERDWAAVTRRLEELRPGSVALRAAISDTRALAARFHAHPEGGAADRVLAEIACLRTPMRELIPAGAVFFESFYGRQVSCNPLAIDREIAARYPNAPRYWSVTSELQRVPEGAVPLLVGGREWHAARRYARLLVVNDWLRYGFKRRPGQTVLQTWHGTMLKHLALGRPNQGLRTRIAIRRESSRWSLMLSQNPHSTAQFRSSYAFRGEILETGYPRDDRLARAVVGEIVGDTVGDALRDEANPVEVRLARAALGVDPDSRVLVYAPTWRDRGITLVDEIDVARLAEELGGAWTIVARGHTRTHAFGSYGGGVGRDPEPTAATPAARVVDASQHPDVNDVILAADLLVTDYSSIMFDASIARVPMAFFVPDLASYRDRERGFTFDFEREAPGPLLTQRAEVVACARDLAEQGRDAAWLRAAAPAADAWRDRFNPHDDGWAAARVVDALIVRGVLG
ncbi:MAG: CDP-glycerol glycerophosphotransferase family protein [Leucobacter sp.]